MKYVIITHCKKCKANMWCTKLVIDEDGFLVVELVCFDCGNTRNGEIDLINALAEVGALTLEDGNNEFKQDMGFEIGKKDEE